MNFKLSARSVVTLLYLFTSATIFYAAQPKVGPQYPPHGSIRALAFTLNGEPFTLTDIPNKDLGNTNLTTSRILDAFNKHNQTDSFVEINLTTSNGSALLWTKKDSSELSTWLKKSIECLHKSSSKAKASFSSAAEIAATAASNNPPTKK